jgi:hypothetical protein
MPIKIDGSESISLHDAFWTALTNNSDSLALSQLWVCGINSISLAYITGVIANEIGSYETDSWGVGYDVSSVIMNPKNWDKVTHERAGDVYLWTRGVSFIGDGINISRIGSQQTGAIKGMISDGRNDLSTANITFLESNVSFVDGILRPWSVLVGYKSLKNENLRCDIELFALEKWNLKDPLKVRKSLVLRNAVPVNIDTEEYNYTGDKLIERQVQFAFDRYELRIYPATTDEVITGPAIEKLINEQLGKRRYLISEKTPSNIDAGNKNYQVSETIPTLTTLGTKKYNISASGNKNKSLLGAIGDALGVVAGGIAKAQGIVNDATSAVAQGLGAFGLNDAANDVSRFNQKIQREVTRPIAEVVGTGQGMVNGVSRVGSTISKITGNSKVNASDVTAELNKASKPVN